MLVQNFQGENIRREVGFFQAENHRAQARCTTVQGADGHMVLKEWRGSGEEPRERRCGLEGGGPVGPPVGVGILSGRECGH